MIGDKKRWTVKAKGVDVIFVEVEFENGKQAGAFTMEESVEVLRCTIQRKEGSDSWLVCNDGQSVGFMTRSGAFRNAASLAAEMHKTKTKLI